MKYGLWVLFLSLLTVGFTQDETWCRGGLFALESDHYSLATINNREPRAHFYRDFAQEGLTCPALNDACREDSYVIPDDVVVLNGKNYQDFSCAWFKPTNGYGTMGWLHTDVLEPLLHNTDPNLEEWQGIWANDVNELAISLSRYESGLIIEGIAFWYGLNDNVHTGSVFGRAWSRNNTLTLFDSDYGCRLELWLLDDFMVAQDNKQCGGVNVTFDGVYSRQ